MKNYLFSLFVLMFCSCGSEDHDVDGDKFRFIQILPSREVYAEYGIDYHGVFTTSDPVYFTGIEVNDTKLEVAREVYENPPFEIAGEGIKGVQHDSQTIEIWVDADLMPTGGKIGFGFELSPIRFWYDQSTIWAVNGGAIVVYKSGKEE